MTYYLKYRSQTIDELDLTGVRETLFKFIKSGELPHAFLFAGPKGTGKTSAARILAKVVNCEKNAKKLGEPCNKCASCKAITAGNYLDVIEFDAASNRGIDDVRSLKDKIVLSPVEGRKKVYIIDEAHMMTTEAFNALLKTLEEPPAHVMFILATTDPHKLPDTIQSRLTTVVFQKANKDEIARMLGRVAKGEKMKLGDEVIELISKACNGSFRDGAKILEQLTLEVKNLTPENVEAVILQKKLFAVDDILTPLLARDAKKAIEEVEQMVVKGGSVVKALELMIERLHAALLGKVGLGEDDLPYVHKADLISLIRLLTKARFDTSRSFISQLPLEIAVAKWCGSGEVLDLTPSSGTPRKETVPKERLVKKEPSPAPEPAVEEKITVKVSNVDGTVWKRVLEVAKDRDTKIEALLRAAKPVNFDGHTLTLGVYYKFHKERLEVVANKQTLEEIVSLVFGDTVFVSCKLAEKEVQPVHEEPLTPATDQDIISAAKEIFKN